MEKAFKLFCIIMFLSACGALILLDWKFSLYAILVFVISFCFCTGFCYTVEFIYKTLKEWFIK